MPQKSHQKAWSIDIWMEIHQFFWWCRLWKKSFVGGLLLFFIIMSSTSPSASDFLQRNAAPYARAPLYQTPSAWCWSPPDLQKCSRPVLGCVQENQRAKKEDVTRLRSKKIPIAPGELQKVCFDFVVFESMSKHVYSIHKSMQLVYLFHI